MRNRIVVLAALAVAASSVRAQAPGVGYIYPPGGKAGTTVAVSLAGTDWTPDVQFFLHDPRVKLEVAGPVGKILFHEPPYWLGAKSKINDPPIVREVPARLVIPADMPAGPIHWRVANANGASTAGVFIVSHDPEVHENETRQGPQEVPVPVTISGRLRRIEEIDQYRFRCAQTGLISCELAARRLGSGFHGVLEAHDAQGLLVAECVDTEGVDPAVTFVGQKDQTYTISVRDVDHRGFRSLIYRLSIFAGPRVVAALPAVGRRGETREVEIVGIGVASGQAKLESVVGTTTFPKSSAPFAFRLETKAGKSSAFAFSLSDLPETVATNANDEPMPLAIPQAVTGRLHKRDDKARFRFAGKKGDAFRITGEARRLGSPLDVALTVLDPTGKELASNDDMPGTTDAQLVVKLPADGTYQIILTDMAGTPPTLTSIYRLVLERALEDFRLETLPTVSVPLGETAKLTVTALRKGGFKEPIQVRVTGLPKGVSVPDNLVIAPTATTLVIPFTCDKNASVSAAFVTIEGSAKVSGQPGDVPSTVTRTATVPRTGDLILRDPAAQRHDAVLLAITIAPPFTVTALEGDGTRRVQRGATHLAELDIERKAGFTGPIVLDAAATQSRHSQGICGSAFPVPPGVAKVFYPVFVPEHVETTTTRRLALVGMAQVKDGAGKEHTVLAPIKGQITMSIEGALLKVAHDAEEIAVSAGQSFLVPLRLVRSTKLTAPARVELVVPEELAGLVQAEPLQLTTKQEAADWKIATRADARLQGRVILHVRATVLRDGHPVISETAIAVEFLPAAQPGR